METTLLQTAIVLECIDGKDDHLTIPVAGETPTVLSGTGGNGTPIRELENQGGAVVLSNSSGRLWVDATDCPLPAKINGNMVTKNELRPGDVLRIGNSIWRIQVPTGAASADSGSAAAGIKKGFTQFIGLEELQDFKLKDIFSQVFRKHSLVEMEDQLVTGTISSTPALTDIETNWARPWLFSRLLLVSLAVSFLLLIGFRMSGNEKLIPGLLFMGSFTVPLSTLVFFLEMNAPRNISIFMTTVLTLIAGVASILIALVLFDKLTFLSSWFGTPAAGIIEEVAKILIVIGVMGSFTRYKWSLNGLLFGAAVGTGFAAFESAGYAFEYLLQTRSFDAAVDVILLRGILSPFGHIIWTGNAAAALWLVKGDRKFEWSMVSDPRFLRVLASSVILHMVWDTHWTLLPLPYVVDLKLVLLGLIGWAITFRLIQAGLKQLNQARHAEVERLSAE